MEQEIRYLDFEGRRLAYSTYGEGMPIVVGPRWVSHLEEEWADPNQRPFYAELGRAHRVVRFDRVGCGLSSRELDPHNLGFAQTSGPGTALFDASLTGNSNAGPWFPTARPRRGRLGRALSDTEKYEIIEYLKAATYADYPMRAVGRPGPLPCQNDPNWAMAIQGQAK